MKKKIIGTILTLLCTSVVAFSGWQVYKIMSEYQSGEKVYFILQKTCRFFIILMSNMNIVACMLQKLCGRLEFPCASMLSLPAEDY